MTHQTSAKKRNELKLRLAKAFDEKIQMLSPDLQEVLLDDIVTAFESRITVLNRANISMHCINEVTEDVELETIQT